MIRNTPVAFCDRLAAQEPLRDLLAVNAEGVLAVLGGLLNVRTRVSESSDHMLCTHVEAAKQCVLSRQRKKERKKAHLDCLDAIAWQRQRLLTLLVLKEASVQTQTMLRWQQKLCSHIQGSLFVVVLSPPCLHAESPPHLTSGALYS